MSDRATPRSGGQGDPVWTAALCAASLMAHRCGLHACFAQVRGRSGEAPSAVNPEPRIRVTALAAPCILRRGLQRAAPQDRAARGACSCSGLRETLIPMVHSPARHPSGPRTPWCIHSESTAHDREPTAPCPQTSERIHVKPRVHGNGPEAARSTSPGCIRLDLAHRSHEVHVARSFTLDCESMKGILHRSEAEVIRSCSPG